MEAGGDHLTDAEVLAFAAQGNAGAQAIMARTCLAMGGSRVSRAEGSAAAESFARMAAYQHPAFLVLLAEVLTCRADDVAAAGNVSLERIYRAEVAAALQQVELDGTVEAREELAAFLIELAENGDEDAAARMLPVIERLPADSKQRIEALLQDNAALAALVAQVVA